MRIALPLAAAAAALLVAPGAIPAGQGTRDGGVLVVAEHRLEHVDPSLALEPLARQLEHATALQLVNYPDARAPKAWRLSLEGASSYKISKDGRTYMFRIRKGLRLSDGSLVTAKNYAYAIERLFSKSLGSPAAWEFLATTPSPGEIVGARAVYEGRSRKVSGVRTSGASLSIRLTRPDPRFLSSLALPLFQAVSLRLPRDEAVTAVAGPRDLPTGGPFAIVSYDRDGFLSLQRNPYYRGSRRPRLDWIVVNFHNRPEDVYREVEAGRADYTRLVPPVVHETLGRRYGVNKGRFRVNPSNCVSFLHLNPSDPLFEGNAALRRAVNLVLDRSAMVATRGVHAMRPHDQLLPPNLRGYRPAEVYPLTKPAVAAAQRLARGNERDGKATLFLTGRTPTGERLAEIVRRDLAKIGIALTPIYDRFGSPASGTIGFATACFEDAGQLVPWLEHAAPLGPELKRRLARAVALRGEARAEALGRLEVELGRKVAPFAPWGVPNRHELLSARVDPRSVVFHPAYEATDLVALTLK